MFLEINFNECWQWCTRTSGLENGFSSDVFAFF